MLMKLLCFFVGEGVDLREFDVICVGECGDVGECGEFCVGECGDVGGCGECCVGECDAFREFGDSVLVNVVILMNLVIIV